MLTIPLYKNEWIELNDSTDYGGDGVYIHDEEIFRR